MSVTVGRSQAKQGMGCVLHLVISCSHTSPRMGSARRSASGQPISLMAAVPQPGNRATCPPTAPSHFWGPGGGPSDTLEAGVWSQAFAEVGKALKK